jgi:hypothetical protein
MYSSAADEDGAALVGRLFVGLLKQQAMLGGLNHGILLKM